MSIISKWIAALDLRCDSIKKVLLITLPMIAPSQVHRLAMSDAHCTPLLGVRFYTRKIVSLDGLLWLPQFLNGLRSIQSLAYWKFFTVRYAWCLNPWGALTASQLQFCSSWCTDAAAWREIWDSLLAKTRISILQKYLLVSVLDLWIF